MSSQDLDGRRVRGDRSRQAVLARATNIASVDGLEGLSIGRLADEVNASKSGVAALFGSKQLLQLATIEAAQAVFVAEVIQPARGAERGLARVWAYCRAWLDYSQNRVFEGGCFFRAAATEFDGKTGPVRDAIVESLRDADSYFQHMIQVAVDNGELSEEADAAQLRFEITALYAAANDESLLFGDRFAYERARRGIRERLLSAGAAQAMLA